MIRLVLKQVRELLITSAKGVTSTGKNFLRRCVDFRSRVRRSSYWVVRHAELILAVAGLCVGIADMIDSHLEIKDLSARLADERIFLEKLRRDGVLTDALPDSPQTISLKPEADGRRVTRRWIGIRSGLEFWPEIRIDSQSGGDWRAYRLHIPKGVQSGASILVDADPAASDLFKSQITADADVGLYWPHLKVTILDQAEFDIGNLSQTGGRR